jgi:hypothetical protein
MPRELVDYSDIYDSVTVTDEQYRANLVHQYPYSDPDSPISKLEWDIDYDNVLDATRVAFCQATSELPEDLRWYIWKMTF